MYPSIVELLGRPNVHPRGSSFLLVSSLNLQVRPDRAPENSNLSILVTDFGALPGNRALIPRPGFTWARFSLTPCSTVGVNFRSISTSGKFHWPSRLVGLAERSPSAKGRRKFRCS